MEITNAKNAGLSPYYVRQAHFDSDRMAGTVSAWKSGSVSQLDQSSSALSLVDGDVSGSGVTPPTASFGELLDIVNPLHHIPLVGNAYRSLTGDEISPVASITGGTIYGGVLGGVSSIAQAMMEEHGSGDVIASLENGTSDSVTKEDNDDAFVDERTAGFNRYNQNDERKLDVAENKMDKPVELASSDSESSSVPIALDDVEWNIRQPVTPVTIELAKAQVNNTPPKSQQWNFNA